MGLNAKLLQLQTEIKNPGYDSTGAFQNEYVSFEKVRHHLLGWFNKVGLLVEQSCVYQEGVWQAVTIVTDVESEETKTFFFPLVTEGMDAQKVAGSFSYARRYSLLGVLTMCGEHDDDGNTAVGIKNLTPAGAYDKKPAPRSKPPAQKQLEQKFGAEEVSPFDEEPPASDYLEEQAPPPQKFELTPEADRINDGQAKFLWVLNNWGLEKGDKQARAEVKEELNLYVKSMGWGEIAFIPWKKFRSVYEQIPRWNPAAAQKIAEVCKEDDARRAARKR